MAELHNLDALEDKEMKRGITPHPDSKMLVSKFLKILSNADKYNC